MKDQEAGPSKSSTSAQKRSRFRCNEQEWSKRFSVLHKINGLQAEAERRLRKSCFILLEDRYLEHTLMACEPPYFTEISQEELHQMHSPPSQYIKSVKRSKKRKEPDEIDETCLGCHEQINTLFLDWITQAREKIMIDHDTEKVGKKKVPTLRRKVESILPLKKGKKTKEDLSGIDCEICCGENIKLEDLTSCTEGHLSCFQCARTMTEIVIGMQKTGLACMSMEDCNAFFHESQVRRFLPEKTFDLWMRMRTAEELRNANIPGMQKCPFCNYAYVAEQPYPLFVCHGKECGIVSCSSCKQKDHRPRTCAELERENQMTELQKAEEKMAEAIIRRCPQPGCNTPIIKDEKSQSCNLIYCPKCDSPMCYICRMDVSQMRYNHFDRDPQQSGKKALKSCPLYDDTMKRHEKELKDIRKALDLGARQRKEKRESTIPKRVQKLDANAI